MMDGGHACTVFVMLDDTGVGLAALMDVVGGITILDVVDRRRSNKLV